MPKLIVYVKADTWRRVEAGYGDAAASLLRGVCVEAIETFLNGPAESSDEENIQMEGKHPLPIVPVGSVAILNTDDPHFKPDEAKTDFKR